MRNLGNFVSSIRLTGFAKGEDKGLWFSAARAGDTALVIVETGIDALSYAALHPDVPFCIVSKLCTYPAAIHKGRIGEPAVNMQACTGSLKGPSIGKGGPLRKLVLQGLFLKAVIVIVVRTKRLEIGQGFAVAKIFIQEKQIVADALQDNMALLKSR